MIIKKNNINYEHGYNVLTVFENKNRKHSHEYTYTYIKIHILSKRKSLTMTNRIAESAGINRTSGGFTHLKFIKERTYANSRKFD